MVDNFRPQHHLDDREIRWKPFTGFDGLSYWVLGINESRQKVDLLFRMAPAARCVPHRHVGPTDTLVIEGEHRTLRQQDGEWVLDQVRSPGFFGANEGDHFHVEEGGSEGTIVLLSMTAVGGVIWETFDFDGQLLSETTMDDFRRAYGRQSANAEVLTPA